MYKVSDNYKKLILDDSTVQALNIYIDGNKVDDDYIFGFKQIFTLLNNNEFILGCTPQIEIKFNIHKLALPETYNEVYVETGLDSELIPMGHYIIEKPIEADEDTVTIKAKDYMSKLDVKYDGSDLTYPKTMLEVLQDICLKTGVELGSTSFLNSDKNIAVYDNQLTARTYVGYIAEKAGGFAYFGRDGKLYIKQFNNYENVIIITESGIPIITENSKYIGAEYGTGDGKDYLADIDLFADFYWGDPFEVSRVSYENGIQDYKFGDTAQNTLYIDSNNMYISTEEEVENIYNSIKGLKLYPFEGETIIDPAYDIGDILVIDGRPVLYQGEIEYEGKFKVGIKSKIQPKSEKESMQTKQSNTTKLRKVQANIDQIEGKITQIIEEQNGTSHKLSEHAQTIDGMKDTIKSVETKAETAQSTADTATTKANNAQTTANTANTNAQNAQEKADENATKITTNTTKITEVEKTVEGITSRVSKTEETIKTVETDVGNAQSTADNAVTKANNAQTTADNINNNLVTNYYTKTETNSQITQKAESITSTVSQTYSTKTETNTAKNQAINSANSSTDAKLQNYSTTAQMNSAIEQKANRIAIAVSETYSKKTDVISEVNVEYALGTSTSTAPTTGWSTIAPTWQSGKYMWQRTTTIFADGSTDVSTPTCIAGAKGQDGTNGTNGVSVSSITEYYAVSTSNSSAPADSSFQTAVQTMTTTNKYLWNYELITYSNNTTSKTSKRVIGVYGDKGNPGTNGTNGTNGIGISSIVNKYAVSSSNSIAPSSWSNTPQTMTATNKYLWNYEIITYSNNTTYTSTPAVIGTYGEKGNIGDTGKGVKAVVAQYYLSSSKTTQTGGSWSETQPTYRTNYYYWTRTKITWTDNTTTYTTPILVEEINSLNESVASLNIRAGNIESTVRTKVGKTEVGTYIQQNTEAVKVAWNQISEFIQMMIINNNASFAILDNNKKVIAYFDKTGEHFCDSSGNVFGEMGVQKIDNNNYISFSVQGDYNTNIPNGMAWGIKTTTDNKFYPILSIENFNIGEQNGDSAFGELVLRSCNLVLDGIGTGLVTGGIFMYGDPSGEGLYFEDENTHEMLFSVSPDGIFGDASISILNNIEFFKNQAGSNSLKLGNNSDKYALLTDEGSIHGNWLYIDGDAWAKSYNNVSTVEEKKEIRKYEKSGIEEVLKTDIYNYRYKNENEDTKLRIGAIIGDGYNISREIIAQNEKGIDTYAMIALAYKAIQEQQTKIDQLEQEIKTLKEGRE